MENLYRPYFLPLLAILAYSVTMSASGAGNPQRGARTFAQCTACHSVEPGRHMTGPSLADVWGRKAGGAMGFLRYSDALKRSDVTWNTETLDKWLTAPAQFVPGNEMAFAGIKDRETRQDLIAFLQAVSEGKAPPLGTQGGGMMGSGRMPNLKRAEASEQVKEIRHCRDTYFVTTMTGQLHKIWEFNLRFKTDSSDDGPRPGRPVLLGAGMRGDRVSIIFSAPNEISVFIKLGCP